MTKEPKMPRAQEKQGKKSRHTDERVQRGQPKKGGALNENTKSYRGWEKGGRGNNHKSDVRKTGGQHSEMKTAGTSGRY